MKLNETFELNFSLPKHYDTIEVEFVINNETKIVKSFKNNNSHTVRFLPQSVGTLYWHIDKLNIHGCEEVTPSDERGVIKALGTHFEDAKGHCFKPFGTTVYALVHQQDSLIDETLNTIKNSPFNKVRMCIFPKWYDYNHDEPALLPFELKDGKPDVYSPVAKFWDKLENTIKRLGAIGVEVDLILFHPYDKWGFARMSKTDCLAYLDYCICRLSAFPNIWWSLANEYDIIFAYKGLFGEFAKFVSEHDVYSHLLSIHNMFSPWDFSDKYTSHVCLQTSDVEHTARLIRKFAKPVVYDEIQYEGNLIQDWGGISGKLLVERIWTAVASGAYCSHGETFLTEGDKKEIIWWAKGGTLKGESVSRIRFLASIMDALPPLEPFHTGLSAVTDTTYSEFMERLNRDPALTDFRYIGSTMTEEGYRALQNMPEKSFSHYEDKIYLYYFGRYCPARHTLDLPNNKKYTVELIDTWEMRKEMVATGVGGQTEIKLPGKECFALLVTQI